MNTEVSITPKEVQDFFTVFVLGEQGFVTKIDWAELKDVDTFLALSDSEMCEWIVKNTLTIQDLLKKNAERVV